MSNSNHSALFNIMFEGVSTNQKMSIFNLLYSIAICDGELGNTSEEFDYLTKYAQLLGISENRAHDYLDELGHKQIFIDLSSLSLIQKDFLIIASWETIVIDGKANDTELDTTITLFEEIGVTRDLYFDSIQRAISFMKANT